MLNPQQYAYNSWLEQRGLTPVLINTKKAPTNLLVKYSKKYSPKILFIKKYSNELFTPEEKNLFLKILQALKIAPQEVMVIGYKESLIESEVAHAIKDHQLVCGLILEGSCKEKPLGEWLKPQKLAIPWLASWSLKDLLSKPQKKKQAWLHYQKALKLLNS
jgi:hypothetical protein